MRQLASKIFDRFFVVVFALIFLQWPFFIHQYEHELVGHVAELKWQNEQIEKAALKSGKTTDHYIKKFVEHDDRDFYEQGKTMTLTKKRYQKLSQALLKLQNAGSFSRPFVFLIYLQSDIVLSTWQHFKPGLTFTGEACFYAVGGMLFGFCLFLFIKKCFKLAF